MWVCANRARKRLGNRRVPTQMTCFRRFNTRTFVEYVPDSRQFSKSSRSWALDAITSPSSSSGADSCGRLSCLTIPAEPGCWRYVPPEDVITEIEKWTPSAGLRCPSRSVRTGIAKSQIPDLVSPSRAELRTSSSTCVHDRGQALTDFFAKFVATSMDDQVECPHADWLIPWRHATGICRDRRSVKFDADLRTSSRTTAPRPWRTTHPPRPRPPAGTPPPARHPPGRRR